MRAPLLPRRWCWAAAVAAALAFFLWPHTPAGPSVSEPVVFNVVTDVHYDGGPSDTPKGSSLDKLRAALRDMRETYSFLVMLGDSKDEGGSDRPQDRRGVEANLVAVAAVVAGAGHPAHWVLGNHDVDRLYKRDWDSIVHDRRPGSETLYSAHCVRKPGVDGRGVWIVVLDVGFASASGTPWNCLSCNGEREHRGWNDSSVPAAQLVWLEATLERIRSDGGVAAVFSHARLDVPQSNREQTLTVRNAADVRRVLSRFANTAPVVFQGHDHRAGHSPQVIDSTMFFTLPSLVDSEAPPHPYASVRIHTTPPCRVDIQGQGGNKFTNVASVVHAFEC